MNPERWQAVREILHAAMERDPNQRSAYLDSACLGDHSLRQEVESLLRADERAGNSFLASPPLESTPLSEGSQLGRYRIVCAVGAGGMGEVYRAHDPWLFRDVAIKVLPSALSANRERLYRFEQEARAAAALNHPAILAVYDVSAREEATPYIVSELLEGETLRERLKRGALSPRKAVEYGLQIANGLAAAHAKDIVHRDLKPENLFLTSDDRVKILDFGLAKLLPEEFESEVTTPTLGFQTEAGTMMGTLGYMSPEQVCAQPVDQRCDIFALGVTVYEMLSGEPAFRGKTRAETISAILKGDPSDLSGKVPGISPALNRLLRRCLEKNPDQRFHSARDLAFALEAISDVTVAGPASALGAGAPKLTRTRVLRYGAVALAIGLAIGIAGSYYRVKLAKSVPSEWLQLTNFPDAVTSPTLSPDGRMLAFLRGPTTFGSKGEVYVKMLPQGEPVQLTHDGTMKMSPVFSPDGSRIAYSVGAVWDTWTVPVLGGQPRLMLPNASGLTWVDDRHILYSEVKNGIHMAIATANESRGEHRDIYVPSSETGMAHNSYLSPDRKWVLVAEMGPGKGYGWIPCRLVPFDGSSKGVPVGPDAPCISAAWSVDGKWMFFSSLAGGAFHIWRQRFPDGKPQQLTSGPTEEEGIAVSLDGQSLVTSVGLASSVVFVHDKSGDRRITFEGLARFPDIQTSSRTIFSPDHSRLYFLGQSGPNESLELWANELDTGGNEQALPGMSVAGSYDVSPDGKQVTFDSLDANGNSHIWIASLDHRVSPRRFESRSPEARPVFGRNGDVYFEARENDRTYLYTRSLDEGSRRKVVSDAIVRLVTISPDDRWAVAEVPLLGEDGTRGVMAYGLRGEGPKRICHNLCFVRWTGDGKSLYISMIGEQAGTQSLAERKTFVIPLQRGQDFPPLPSTGFRSEADLAQLPGVQVIKDLARPGPDNSIYAFDRFAAHRNLYRIPIP
jgi:Tol biopolymer transport system component